MNNHRANVARVLVIVLLGLALVAPIFAVASDGSPTVVVEDNRVSLAGEGASLETVLTALAEEAGLTLVLRGRLTEPWSQSLRELSLPQTLSRLLGPGGHAYVLRSRSIDGSGERQRVLTVISAAPRAAAKPVPDTANAPAVPAVDDAANEAELQDVQTLLEGVLDSDAADDDRTAALEALQEIEALARTR